MKMVGHKTESVYRRYAIVDEAMLRDAAVKLAARRGQRPGQSGLAIMSRCRGRARKNWWAGTGLNRRHQDFQSCALPTELPAHQTREDNRRARKRPLPERCARLLDRRDDAERPRFLEEQRDDDDLAGLELARELRERDALAAGLQAHAARG